MSESWVKSTHRGAAGRRLLVTWKQPQKSPEIFRPVTHFVTPGGRGSATGFSAYYAARIFTNRSLSAGSGKGYGPFRGVPVPYWVLTRRNFSQKCRVGQTVSSYDYYLFWRARKDSNL
jgi:hypothetical protein